VPLFDASHLEDVTDSIFRAVGAPEPVARRVAHAGGVDETLRQAKAVPPAPQFPEVLVPGEPESRTRADRQKKGVYVEDSTEAAIRQVASALGVDTATFAARAAS